MKTFREHIHEQCVKTNMKDPEDATLLVQYLAHELIRYHDSNMMYEEKLKELMTAKDHEQWAREAAKKLFRSDIEAMDEGDFKDFIKENFEKIVQEE